MPEKRVLLAMSGGTDSSVAAIILKDRGFEVVGITFLFSDSNKNNQTIIHDSSEIAKQLGLAHHIIDLKNEFE